MADTSIEWADKVWNPVLGCSRVSAGCEHCYAERLAHRLALMGQQQYEGLTKKLPNGEVRWTGKVVCLPERLSIPLGWKKPARIFVNSMSDLFHEDVPDTFIERTFDVMRRAPQHTFQVLTKRPARMNFLLDRRGLAPLPNVWLGVSVEDQRAADERIPLLLQTPAAVHWLSCEPLLGPVNLGEPASFSNVSGFATLDWIVAGGESGPNYRPMDLEWARSLRDQCQAAGVPFHFKQWGGRTHAAGGRMLDGRTWDEYPEPRRELAGV